MTVLETEYTRYVIPLDVIETGTTPEGKRLALAPFESIGIVATLIATKLERYCVVIAPGIYALGAGVPARAVFDGVEYDGPTGIGSWPGTGAGEGV